MKRSILLIALLTPVCVYALKAGDNTVPVVTLERDDARMSAGQHTWSQSQAQSAISESTSPDVASVQASQRVKHEPDVRFASIGDFERLQRQVDYLTQANLPEQIRHLQSQFSQLQGMFEVQMHEIQNLQRQVNQITKTAQVKQAIIHGRAVPPASYVTRDATSALPADKSQDLEAHRQYKEIFSQLKAKSYEAAQRGLEKFVTTYPDSSLTANAYYWLGEVYFIKANYEKARTAFTHVLVHFPKSRKAPDAQYKLAMVQMATNQNAKAMESLKMLRTHYAGSSAARLAKLQLEQNR